MLSERFSRVAKVVLALVPFCYGGVLLAALPATLEWFIVAVVILLALVVLIQWLDYPLQTVWPVFPGAFLVVACSLLLYHGSPPQGPVSGTATEVIISLLWAMLYIIWGIRSTWKAVTY